MTQAMQLMVKEIIEKDLSFREIFEIMKPLSFVLNDRKNRDYFIEKRFHVDNAELRKKFEERIRWFEDEEKEDINDAELVLRMYDLKYDVDELLGTD